MTKSHDTKSPMYVGERHYDEHGNPLGGIKVVVDGSQMVEVERSEMKICEDAYNSDEILTFTNKTNKKILDYIHNEFSCKFDKHHADSGDFILCRLVVLDPAPHNRKGTVRQILDEMQAEKSCNVSFGKSTMKKGGKIAPKATPHELKQRWDKKKEHITSIAQSIQSLRNNVTRDIKSGNDKDRLTALAIAVIDKTSERVGNEESAANGHVGVTGLQKKHIKIDGNTVYLNYIGKSGTEQNKQFTDELLASELRRAIKESNCDFIFCTKDGFQIKADRINRYLSEYKISVKDIRGYAANYYILDRLKKCNLQDINDEKKRKREFNKCVKYAANKVGHGASTLKTHYLIPELQDDFIKHGKLIELTELHKGGIVKHEDGGEINPSKTPAPLKDRIHCSEKNAPNSASDLNHAKNIELSAAIVKIIEHKVSEYNKLNPSKKISSDAAKAVVRRGMGAYSVTHRPTITDGKPNSRMAWGLARLNAFIFKAEHGYSKSGNYIQDDDLLDELHIKHKKYADGGEVEKFTISNVKEEIKKPKVIVLNNTDSPYDKTARQIILKYLSLYNGKRAMNKMLAFLKNSNQQYKNSDVYIYINGDYYAYADSVSRIYNMALSQDDESPDFIRIKQKDGIIIYIAAPQSSIFGDYIGDYYDENGRIKKEVTDQAIEAIAQNLAIPNDIKYADGGEILLAPNGKISNLTPEQYKLVRTPEFISWFGDWLHDPANASKVVDENGEPLVVYHGTNTEFWKFDLKTKGKNTGWENTKYGFFFIADRGLAENFTKENGAGNRIISAFLSIKKPLDFTIAGLFTNEKQASDIVFALFGKKMESKKALSFLDENVGLGELGELMEELVTDKVYNHLKDKNYNGLISEFGKGIKEYIAFNPEQIKLADGTNTTFDPHNPDIRYEDGGDLKHQTVGCIIYHPEHGYLILKRGRLGESTDGMWHILSGGVDAGEDKDTAVKREIQEEIGYEGDMYIEHIESLPFEGYDFHYYYVELKDPIDISLNYENADVAWLTNLNDIFEYNLIPALEDYLQNNINVLTEYKQGGQFESENAHIYKIWKELVNMSAKELQVFYNSEEGKKAGLSSEQAHNLGIHYGRESARWIIKMKELPSQEWTPKMWEWAERQIRFIKRMSGNHGELIDKNGNKTRKYLSLLIWGNDPMKKENGGNIKMPKLYIHYSDAIFDKFAQAGDKEYTRKHSLTNKGIYFNEADTLIKYGKNKYEVQLFINKPFIINNGTHISEVKNPYTNKRIEVEHINEEDIKFLKEQGYDAVQAKYPAFQTVVFDKDQTRIIRRNGELINEPIYSSGGELTKSFEKKLEELLFMMSMQKIIADKLDLIDTEIKNYEYNLTALTADEYKFVSELFVDIESEVKHNKSSVEKIAAKYEITDKTQIKELTELAIILKGREISLKGKLTEKQKYEQLVKLYFNQPNLSHRSSESIKLQQYSTAIPIGYLMGLYCGIGSNKKTALYFEPSAGNGALTIAGYPDEFIVNELDKQRLKDLKFQNFKEVLNQDATKHFNGFDNKFDAVLTNPPFGAVDAIDYNGYKITSLEHTMALNALQTMKDEGKAAIIIGGHSAWDKEGRIQAGKNRSFFVLLNELYDVEDVINIDGHALYSRQGTAFDIRLILINGRRKKPAFPPLLNETLEATETNSGKVVKTFEDLWIRVDKIR